MSLKQLTQELGLSKSTVSRALNGYADVSPATRQRVQQAAERIGYRPNPTAVKLAKGKSHAVGIILPVSGPQFVSPAFSRLLAGASEELALHDHHLTVTMLPETCGAQKELQIYEQCIRGSMVDGLLMVRPRQADQRLALLREHSFPYVVHGRCELAQSGHRACQWLDVDNQQIFFQLTMRQLQQGHRNIALIDAQPELLLSIDRQRGFQRALRQVGVTPNGDYIRHGDLSVETGHRLAGELLGLPVPPTAILCADDHIALGAIAACKARGLEVGRDLAITGYGDYEQGRFSQPTLTTASYDTFSVGRELARRLLRQIGVNVPAGTENLLSAELVVRDSDSR